ncbi:MAG TPA: hypothetical protein VFV75_19140 [Candidatus Polarisedimenticolaceae bacterium]|nr:hypothetical protein [Candidatus Polarisedimenticolaceae bacterium]
MTSVGLLALAGLLLGVDATPPLASSQPAVAPGTAGVVRTILTGDRIEEIPLRFLGLYHGAAGPGHDLYLVRLEGEEAERVGIAAGMSGSPVYVEGKVVGALSYRMGALPKEPVAGVTPIEDLLGAARFSRPAPPGADQNVVPIATPLLVGGLLPAVRDYLAPALAPYGLIAQRGGAPVAGASGSAMRSPTSPLEPGSAVGAALIRGDLDVAAVGTVAWVEGDAVFAFGHPFLGTGRVEMPMLQAEVVHTLAALGGSVKLSNLGAEIGSIVEDRLTGIVGTLGTRARMLPIVLHVRGGDYPQKDFKFEVVRQSELTPVLAGAALANALFLNTGYDEQATVRAHGTLRLRGLPDVALTGAYTSGGRLHPVLSAASEIQRTLELVYRNPFQPPEVESVDLAVEVVRERRRYAVDAVHYDRGNVRPGQTLTLRCALRSFRDEPVERTFALHVPEGLPAGAGLTLVVGSPDAVARAEGRPVQERLRNAVDLAGYVRALSGQGSADTLTAALVWSAPGAVARGARYDELPGTVARLLASDAAGLGATPLDRGVLVRAEEEMDGPVEGSYVARLEVSAP